jgi:hypothetical protein
VSVLQSQTVIENVLCTKRSVDGKVTVLTLYFILVTGKSQYKKICRLDQKGISDQICVIECD